MLHIHVTFSFVSFITKKVDIWFYWPHCITQLIFITQAGKTRLSFTGPLKVQDTSYLLFCPLLGIILPLFTSILYSCHATCNFPDVPSCFHHENCQYAISPCLWNPPKLLSFIKKLKDNLKFITSWKIILDISRNKSDFGTSEP